MRRNLTKSEILRRREDIRRVFLSGREYRVSGVKIKSIKNNFAFTRVLITFVKKYGRSVDRNRAKRIVREIYRQMKEKIMPGYDIVFILFPGTYSFQDRFNQISEILGNSGLLQTSTLPRERDMRRNHG
jgi:ribonuclease P protein component